MTVCVSRSYLTKQDFIGTHFSTIC